jgi:RNA polymerase sigma-70 factor, ECF subfamily
MVMSPHTVERADRCESAVTPGRETASTRIDRDGPLVKALRRREPTAAERLVATYGDRAYRLAVGITGNRQDAEEAVQDAFWSVIRKIDTFRGHSALGSWVYRIVVNAAVQLRRRARRCAEIPLEEALPPFREDGRHAGPITDWSASIEDPIVQAELRAALDSAISELPAGHRAVIVLRDIEGLPMAEVAGSLGISIANAKCRTHRARLFLRKRLGNFMSDATVGVAAPSQEQRAATARIA